MSGAGEATSVQATTVHACGPAERAQQAELFNACFKKRANAALLAWRYDENPHGAAASFVARDARGLAVSGYACSPRRALARGDEATLATVGETGDVMTRPEWRKRGLFSALDKAALAETRARNWPFVFGLPNRRSAHVFLELGWKQAGTLRTWTFLLKADARARAERAKQGRLRAWLAAFDAGRQRTRRARLAERLGGLEVRALTAFPPEALELARVVERRFAWMVRRDPAYLAWRFLENPSRLHRALGLYRAGRLAAWIVVELPRGGAGGGWIVDLIAPHEADAAAAIAAALDVLEQAGASFAQASAVDRSWWSSELARAGFLPPRRADHLIVIAWQHAPEHALARAGLDASAWYLTDGDRDDETMG